MNIPKSVIMKGKENQKNENEKNMNQKIKKKWSMMNLMKWATSGPMEQIHTKQLQKKTCKISPELLGATRDCNCWKWTNDITSVSKFSKIGCNWPEFDNPPSASYQLEISYC